MFVNEIAVGAFSFRGWCNYRPSSVYFILFVLFFHFFFCIFFASLRFGSHFRSHDSHVTGEHMVELGAIFVVVFSARANSSSMYKDTYMYTVYLK